MIEKGSWSFGNDYAGIVATVGVDYSSSSHTDNQGNDFLISGEGDTFRINGRFGAPEKRFSITMVIKVFYLLMERKSVSLKLVMEMLTF